MIMVGKSIRHIWVKQAQALYHYSTSQVMLFRAAPNSVLISQSAWSNVNKANGDEIVNSYDLDQSTIQLCKHVVAKVTLVPCSVNLTGKRDKVGYGEVTINNARII